MFVLTPKTEYNRLCFYTSETSQFRRRIDQSTQPALPIFHYAQAVCLHLDCESPPVRPGAEIAELGSGELRNRFGRRRRRKKTDHRSSIAGFGHRLVVCRVCMCVCVCVCVTPCNYQRVPLQAGACDTLILSHAMKLWIRVGMETWRP